MRRSPRSHRSARRCRPRARTRSRAKGRPPRPSRPRRSPRDSRRNASTHRPGAWPLVRHRRHRICLPAAIGRTSKRLRAKMRAVSTSETHRAIEAVFRIEQARLIAGLARMVKDVGTAEELAQDALVTALEKWPSSGVPDNPGAWLMQTAKNRAIDQLRKHKMADGKHEELGRVQDEARAPAVEEAIDAAREDVGDDLLRLIFVACHPVLSTEARVA